MRHGWLPWCAAIGLAMAAPLYGQTPGEPRLFWSVFVGYRAGERLWVLHDQPFGVLVPSGDTAVLNSPGQYDTLDLVRRSTPSLLIGTTGAYFPTPGLGFEAELAFLGMSLESSCAIRQYQPADPNDLDPELCTSLTGQSVTTSAVSASIGLVGRINPAGSATPYARLDAGVVARSRGTIALNGTYTSANQSTVEATVLEDEKPRTTDVHVTVGAGVAFSLGTGYQLRFEGRDVMARLDRVTGPATGTDPATGSLTPPHGGHFFHNLAFVVALDVIFEKRRGRRY